MELKCDSNAEVGYYFCFTVYRPSAPEPPVVTEVHLRNCTVTYQPPSDDGGAPVTGYVLERRTPGPDSKWIRVSDTPITDLKYTTVNLTPATEHEFRVAAVNKKEAGIFSLMSAKIMTVEKPDKPGRPKVVEVVGTSVRLQWTAPNSNGGADITEYRVSFCNSDEKKDIAVPTDTNNDSLITYTLRNQLQAHQRYTFAVAAVNRTGQGSWSDELEEILTFAGMLNIREFHMSIL